jgi:hypothetical protein
MEFSQEMVLNALVVEHVLHLTYAIVLLVGQVPCVKCQLVVEFHKMRQEQYVVVLETALH